MLAESDVLRLVAEDSWRMTALRAVREQRLPDWWIVAGFLRNLVWDHLHGYQEPTPPSDIDVVYFDPINNQPAHDQVIEQRLRDAAPGFPWEVCNQARMHTYNGHAPYRDSVDSFSRWAETVSTIGIRLDDDDRLQLAAPHGFEDLRDMVIRPTPHPDALRHIFEQRLTEKNWTKIWPKAVIRLSE